MANKIVIGLTGNIATGKSLVLRMLQELGATTIDADKLAHRLMRQGGSVYQAIVEEFGKFILDDSGQISRVKLGKIVFSDPTALSRLESLTHPGVIDEVKKQIEAAQTQVVVVEAIKLFEAGLAEHCNATWAIVAPPQVQYKRLIERRKMKPKLAEQRIKAQPSQQEKARKADLVIDNSGALAKTWTTVKTNYSKLLQSQAVALAPEPEPATVAAAPAPKEFDVSQVILRRAKRGDLNGMAELIAVGTGNALKPDVSEMMEALFSRAYLVATVDDYTVGMIGWQTENLVAGLQDFYVRRNDLWKSVGVRMLETVHDEINSLSCEVSLVFVLNQAGQSPLGFLESQGYEQFDRERLIPDWREAAVEWQPDGSTLLYKKLREQRIMVPM
jgi:dephospho-CoA kinase